MAKKPTTARVRKKITVPKTCYFCSEKKIPEYTDTQVLQRFLTDRGKIIGRVRTGICATHQRQLASAVKHARHLAMLPFVVRD